MRRSYCHKLNLVTFFLLALPLYTKGERPANAAPSQQAQRTTTTSPPPLPSLDVRVDGKQHRIFITIDDHPGRFTNKYLDILSAYKIKAAFFIVAYDLYAHLRTPDYEPLLSRIKATKRITKEGHIIGNHSITHGLLCKMRKSMVRWEVHGAQRLIKKVLGIKARYWRPPHGHICQSVRTEVRALKLVTVMWDVDDYRSTPQSMMRIIRMRVARGHTQTIVLFHNKLSKFTTFLKLLHPAIQPPAHRTHP